MVALHNRLDGHEFEQAPGVGDGQEGLACMGSQRVRHDWATELNINYPNCFPESYNSSSGKESCNAGDPGWIPGSGGSPREGIGYPLQYSWASLVTRMVKNPTAKWETWVWSLSWKDPLEKGMATHSSLLAWRIPRTEEPGRLQPMRSQRVRHDWVTFTFTFIIEF